MSNWTRVRIKGLNHQRIWVPICSRWLDLLVGSAEALEAWQKAQGVERPEMSQYAGRFLYKDSVACAVLLKRPRRVGSLYTLSIVSHETCHVSFWLLKQMGQKVGRAEEVFCYLQAWLLSELMGRLRKMR